MDTGKLMAVRLVRRVCAERSVFTLDGFTLRREELARKDITRTAGIEPTQTVLKTVVLPLNYAPKYAEDVRD